MMRVSIVICTLNRAQGLAATLASLRQQRYPAIEVVVVNGPSTDGTESVLSEWSDRIKIEHCTEANLSMSRNIGIRAASGDVVAFIDDDALPEFGWLEQAVPAFDDPEVAAVGGIVFDHTGVTLQYSFSAATRFGETTYRTDRPFDDQCVPGSFQFPYVQGTNALFRRSVLEMVGGFDETYDYYLDETDLCCRVIDAGFVVRQLADAPVHHKFLPSDVRNHQRVVANWFPIVKNQMYFAYRHALGPFSDYEIQTRGRAFVESCLIDAQAHEDAGRLPPGSTTRAALACGEAFARGMELGRSRHDIRLGPVTWPAGDFKDFPTLHRAGSRRFTFVSSGYTPRLTGGISRFISDVAPAIARQGHEVRVVTLGDTSPTVDLEEGVWVHRVVPAAAGAGVAPEAFPHIDQFATAALQEIERVCAWSRPDLVYGPLWDVEVLGILRRTALPVVVQVATPIAVAARMAGHFDDGESGKAMRRLMDLEDEVLATADMFHANSTAVSETIRTSYPHQIDERRWQVVHLGLVDRSGCAPLPIAGNRKVVLYVGRFEVRKGTDNVLEMISRIAPDDETVEFVLIGEDRPLAPGQQHAGAAWRDAHVGEPWSSRVHFLGDVDDDTLHAAYSRADLVVLPSRYESFGLVMVEAMMHGKALISCDTSGIRDVVRNGLDGVLVEPGDTDALIQEVRKLLNSDDRRRELGAAARTSYVERFHIERFADRLQAMLARVRFTDAVELVGPVVGTRRGAGDGSVVLCRGDRVAVACADGATSSILLRSTMPATIMLIATDPIELVIEPGRVVRFAMQAGVPSVTIEVVHGEIDLLGQSTVAAIGSGQASQDVDS